MSNNKDMKAQLSRYRLLICKTVWSLKLNPLYLPIHTTLKYTVLYSSRENKTYTAQSPFIFGHTTRCYPTLFHCKCWNIILWRRKHVPPTTTNTHQNCNSYIYVTGSAKRYVVALTMIFLYKRCCSKTRKFLLIKKIFFWLSGIYNSLPTLTPNLRN